MFRVLYLVAGRYMEVFETETESEANRVFVETGKKGMSPCLVDDKRKKDEAVGMAVGAADRLSLD